MKNAKIYAIYEKGEKYYKFNLGKAILRDRPFCLFRHN